MKGEKKRGGRIEKNFFKSKKKAGAVTKRRMTGQSCKEKKRDGKKDAERKSGPAEDANFIPRLYNIESSYETCVLTGGGGGQGGGGGGARGAIKRGVAEYPLKKWLVPGGQAF